MIEKHLGKLKRKMELAVIGLAVVVIVLGVCAFLHFTKPFAVSADGAKVEEPWVVKIGDKEEFVVANEKEGKEIIEGIKNNYVTEKAKAEEAVLSPQIKVVEKELNRGDENPSIVEKEDAVAEVVAANKTEKPLVTVTTTEKVSDAEAIDYKTEYKKSDDLFTGEEKVVAKGKKGKKTIVSELTMVNGELVGKEVVSTKVEQQPANKVIEQGTKTMTASKASQVVSRGGAAMGRGSGKDAVNYAMKFVGNPYVYGGTSLTNGADCSGFTMGVYAKFGVSLPHSSSAQRSYGKGVSYSEAKPGDIICYSGHVAIYMGNGKIVHASTPSTGIKVSSATYKSIITVRRIIE